MTMRRPYQIGSILFFLFSVFVARESLHLKLYTALGPGPGFFPLGLSLVFAILACLQFYHATWGTPEPMPSDFFASKIGYLRALAVIVAMAGVVALMGQLGFRFTIFCFLLFLMVVFGRVNWFATIAVAVIGSWGTFYVFDQILDVPLPVGMFGF